ncbi:MAG: triple tyrosine motif-containing protein, partial [Ginsengibacter sp.]
MRKTILYSVLVLFFSLMSVNVFAQYDSLHFKMFAPELFKQADVRSIVLAKSGKLWLGTSDGLASFDGNEITYLSQYRNEGAGFHRIERLIDDGRNNLWFPYEDKLIKMNVQTGKMEKIAMPYYDSTSNKTWYSFSPYMDKQGQIWMALGNNGFVVYDTAAKKFEHYNFDSQKPAGWEDHYKNRAYYFTQDSTDGNIIWIAEYGDGVFMFDKNKKSIQKRFRAANNKDSTFTSTTATSLDVKKDKVWFGTWGNGMGALDIKTGLYEMYPAPTAFYVMENGLRRLASGRAIGALVKKSDSEYLVACRDTLPAIFNINTKKYSYLQDAVLNRSLPAASDIKVDAKNNVWCLKGGNIFISSPRYNLFKEIPFAKPRPVSRDAIELRDIVWDSTRREYYAGVQFSAGIYVFDSSFKTKKIIPMPFSHGKNGVADAALVWRLRKDKNNHLWALGEKLFMYDSLTQKMKDAAEIFHSLPQLKKEFEDFEFDANGTMYLHSNSHELLVWNFEKNEIKEIKFPEVKRAVPTNFSTENIVIDNRLGYLYTSDANTIYQYNLHSGVFNFISPDSLPEPRINGYATDNTGNLWVQSDNNGIRIFNETSLKSVRNITIADGLTGNLGEHIISGPDGCILFFNPQGGNLYSCADSSFINFDIDNGLLSDVPIYISYAHQHFFFTYARMGRTQYADVSTLLSLQKNIQPYINSIRVVGTVIQLDTLPEFLHKLVLPYYHSSIELGFSCIEVEFPERVDYAYKLQGVDKDWNYTNYLNRRVSYVNIKPGTYTFYVRARMTGGKWTYQNSPLKIIIMPAWWQTIWFKILSLIIALLLAWLFIKRRMKTVRKQEQLKSRHEKEMLEYEAKALRAQMNPHFVFNCLNSIK